jgi:ferric-dicitrate binding protein FerR (iron transport regulator)
MRLKTNNHSFIRFLKDEKFIEWKLFSTDELNAYWKEYLQQHPDEKEDLLIAEKHLLKINLSSYKMSSGKKQEAMKRLEQSLKTYHRKLKIRRFAYAAAAGVAALILSVLYIQKEMGHSGHEMFTSADYIVGSELESEDILFITGNRTTSFHSNVDIQIDGDKTAQIRSKQEEEKLISIEQHTMNKLIVPYGKRSKIILSDGTQVWLNSGSSLEFPSAFSRNSRKVLLSGEMYIEVATDKNSPFYVHTSGYNVKVYGTKFNVSSYPGSTSSVVLVEGIVGLQAANKQELVLSPREQAIYSDNGTFQTQKVDVTPFISWKEGYLSFEDTPVTEALKQIERYYNLSFNYGDNISFQGLTCTGKIILSDNLDNVMTTLSLISDTKYKKEDKLIYIYKK